jgi:uridine phosphorylase
MKRLFLCTILTLGGIHSAHPKDLPATSHQEINLALEDCVLVKYPVPDKGIVCSNYERALRLTKKLDNLEMHKSAWGPFVATGDYRGRKIFVSCAPIGSGAGLVFTELFVAGAKYIIRYGSDDVKSPPASDAYLVKIVDEADNLFGFNIQSGVDPKEWGQSIEASPQIVKALISTAKLKGIVYEMRICHHLENYHGLRLPHKFSPERSDRIKAILEQLNQNSKSASYDMETAVLFRVAKDFGLHAATVLQTVNKESARLSAYEGVNYQQAREVEEGIFFNYVLDALLEI